MPQKFDPPNHVYIIAEAGSNHYGNLNIALGLVSQAAKCGADAVKFQLFKLEDILKDPNKGERWWELNPEWLPKLKRECDARGIDFVCTPFAEWAVDELDGWVDVWKIGSFEAHNDALWRKVFATGKPIIAAAGRGLGNHALFNADYILYCVSKYPAPETDIDLSEMGRTYSGISDHTLSTMVPALAVARGALVVEKHFRVRQSVIGRTSPDNGHSLYPSEFAEMVNNIRYAEMLCKPKVVPLAEFPNRKE